MVYVGGLNSPDKPTRSIYFKEGHELGSCLVFLQLLVNCQERIQILQPFQRSLTAVGECILIELSHDRKEKSA